ncbi:MAG: helix-turn-helix domain-containing protein [Sulfuritalea sp.]|nr:helix-turn-helix domain-containing protein [Sulfuritalea sp.]
MTDNDKLPEITEKKDSELSIGERIQKKRKQLDFSVDQLALLTAAYDFGVLAENDKGLSSQTLYRYEKGEREPATREIRLLCEALNVSADWLIFGKDWNYQQEADTILANSFRALIKNVNDEDRLGAILNKNISRKNMHEMKVLEIRNRNKNQ